MPKPKSKRKPGRPSMGKRNSFTFRVRDNTRASLEASAKLHHVSVSEEIERRLEVSFAYANFAAYLFGGEETLKFVMRVAGAISRAEQRLGRRWFTDYSAVIQTKAAVMQEMSDHVLIEQIGREHA